MSGEENQFNVQGYNIVTILKRLEAATSRLEDITVFQEEANKHHNNSNSSTNLITSQNESNSGLALKDSETPVTSSTEEKIPEPKSIVAFKQFINESVSPFVENSKSIDPLVGESAQLFQQAFEDQIQFLTIVSQSQKPDYSDPLFAELLAPTNEKITKINNLKDDNRRSNFFNHLNTLSESAAVIFWFGVPTPVSYVSDIKDSAKFWSDRVLKEYKDKDNANVEWVKQVSDIFDNLKAYVKEYQTQGPSWNANGKPFAQAIDDFKSSNKTATDNSNNPPAAASASAPAPPPPPPASFFEESNTSANPSATASATAPEGGMNAVFAQLNQGSNVTSGLKKVDKSEMTHKNPELRKQPPVAPKKPKNLASSSSASSNDTNTSSLVKKPAKKELVDGTKWIIQNFTQSDASGPIVIEVEMHQSVFIGNCSDITIQLKGKANAISISETKNIGIVIDSLISGVDIIKSFKYGIQVLGLVPMISIDKSDEGSIYLSNESIQNQCQVFTSSTTALNINIPEANDDFKELAVPEQFVSTIKDGKLVSQIVEHAG
ncbi:SRV2 [Candida pseudojiufengensis]|uniref:SRV2 n=1 Tax=Candida pseudojiufengensis TaxID=497109 RepID=UPI0022258B1A|nr:SRV2 [Candida pseudojiufengensis]KAI5962442.1 SRV2 [Candida pseudojiufengensis]